MDLIISGKNFKLTPSLKTYVTEKFQKLGRFWKRIIRVRVELEVDHKQKSGEIYRVETNLEIPGPDIRLDHKAYDMHAAIDEVIPKLERMISKVKGKFEGRMRRVRKQDS